MTKRKKKRKQIVWGVIFLGLVSCLVGISWLWQKARGSIWDGQTSLGVVYQVKDRLSLVIIMPDYLRRVELVIPGNTMVKSGFGYGEYQLKNVYELGGLEGQGGRVLSRAVENLMAVGVTGWQAGEVTNLSWWDRLRLWWCQEFKLKKKTVVELSQQSAFKAETLGDGAEVFRVSQVLVDELVNRLVFEEKLVEEGLIVAVLNASQAEGVAKNMGRIIANLGGEVRLISNLESQSESRLLVAKKEWRDSYTAKRLQGILGVEEIGLGEIDEYRADIVVMVGEDYTKL